MKAKRELPIWSALAVIAGVIVVVVFLFTRVGSGDASKEDIMQMRKAEENRPLTMPAPSGALPRQ